MKKTIFPFSRFLVYSVLARYKFSGYMVLVLKNGVFGLYATYINDDHRDDDCDCIIMTMLTHAHK